MDIGTKVRKARSVGWRTTLDAGRSRLLFKFGFVTERLGLQVLPVHYYSVVPSLHELRANEHRWAERLDLSAVALSIPTQEGFLRDLPQGPDGLPDYAQVERANPGEGMGPVDAELLYRVVRGSRPTRVVEVGSGTSTVFIAAALQRNAADGHEGRLLSIEPYRGRGLDALVGDVPFELIARPVQDVDLAVFESLEAGDVLFIDSTHVARVGSDVMFLVLQVLPRLRPGVLVHIHDIPFPYGVLDSDDVLQHHLFWNEWALVLAYLSHNPTYEVVACNRLLHHDAPSILDEVLATYSPGVAAPSSLWLRRTTG